MRPWIVITMTLALVVPLSAYAVSETTASMKTSTVTKPRVKQSSSGCASPNIDSNSGHVQIAVDCSKITAVKLNTHMSSLEINQERLLLAKNPTELRITNAYLQHWLPDGQRISLTLEFENPRDIPIPEIEIDILDPKSGASIPTLEPFPFTRSQVYREAGSNKFSLAAGGKTSLPIAFLDEIIASQSIGSDFCAFDAALSLDRPTSDPSLPDIGWGLVLYRSLLVRVRLKSIFNQRLSSTQWVWITYGRGDYGMQFWYPSKKLSGTLTCIR